MPKDIFTDPGREIARAKKEKALGKSVGVLALDWILIAIALYLSATLAGSLAGLPLLGSFGAFLSAGGATATAAATTFVVGLIGSLFLAYPLQIVMSALGGKGKYFEALTPISYSLLVASVGLLVAAILSYIPSGVGAILAFVVLAVTLPLSLAVLIRGVKDMWKVDWLATLIGLGVFALGVGAAGISAAVAALPLIV